MKKLLFVLALGFGVATFAQKTTTTTTTTKSQMSKMTPEQMTEKKLKKLTEELKLDAAQQQKVGPLLSERNMKVKDLKMHKDALAAKGAAATSEEKKMLAQKMKAQKSDFEMKMKGVLTPDQFQKWLKMREEGMEKMKEKKGMKSDFLVSLKNKTTTGS